MERRARERAVAAEQQQVKLRQEAEQARSNEAELRRQAETREKITQAAFLLSQDKYDEADDLLSRVSLSEPTLEGAAVFRSVGEWYALHNQWKLAVERFQTLLQIDALDGWDTFTLDYLECGPALIETGDLKAYEAFRLGAVQRFTNTSYPATDRILKISLLLPAPAPFVDSLESLGRATEKSFSDAHVEGDVFQAAWRSVSLALLEYRRGNWSKAAEWSRRCLAYPEFNAPRAATAKVILAMALKRLGQTDAARTALGEGRQVIDGKFRAGLERGSGIQGFWFDWVFAQILLQEASSLVAGASHTPVP
jgi:tetratricopeptide (TPR) repeat protein